MRRTILSMRQIKHQFGGYLALHGVDFNLLEGEIHALVGDHRSGKTTFGKIIAGVEKRQSGYMYFQGREITQQNIKQAQRLGIGMVCQRQNMVMSLNAVDNIYSGYRKSFFITASDRREMDRESRKIIDRFDTRIPLHTPLYKLNETQQLIVNICSVLIRHPKVLIIDEIAANMPPEQLELVFSVLRELKAEGTSLIYITSNFSEIFKIADRVTIFKDGYRKGTEQVTALDPARLIEIAFNPQEDSSDPPGLRGFLDAYQESIINDLPIGEVLINEELEVVFSNVQACTILGVTPPRGTAETLDQLFYFLTDDQRAHLSKAVTKGTAVEVGGVQHNDSIIKLTAGPIYSKKKQIIGANIFIEDVSFDYQTREYLMKARKAANTAELAAGVAHEIKNPLAIIQNYVELLKMSALGQDDKSSLQSIEKELYRITEIIGNLLSFSKVRQAPFQPVSITKILDEVILLLGHKLSLKQIRIEKRYDDAPILTADENKLKQLFMNLIMNAIEAVLEEGIIQVHLVRRTTEGLIDIRITDNGYGISEDVSDKIFSPFFTTKMARTNIGLGLSICQTIVESHGGVMKFSSVPGEHTTFSITLPITGSDQETDH
jgi:two-component system, NtrC family, sensor histidine kinase AtoS